jgi:hypothetical protein
MSIGGEKGEERLVQENREDIRPAWRPVTLGFLLGRPGRRADGGEARRIPPEGHFQENRLGQTGLLQGHPRGGDADKRGLQ